MLGGRHAGGPISDARGFGKLARLHDCLYWRLQITTGYHAFRVFIIRGRDLMRDDHLDQDPRYRSCFLEPEQLLALSSAHPQLVPKFIQCAPERGARCYGVFDGESLAAYGWYSTVPTPIERDLSVGFGSRWVYVHDCFTVPEYRGRRLNGIGVGRALHDLAEMGYRGLIALVETDNHASLRSFQHMGCQIVGHVRVATVGGRLQSHVSRGCRPYGIACSCPPPLRSSWPSEFDPSSAS